MWPVGHNRSHLPHLHPLQHTIRHKCVATEMQEVANEMQEVTTGMLEVANEMQEVATEMQEATTEMQEVATARIIWKNFL